MHTTDPLIFPEHFTFGTAISAYQVEGNASEQRRTDWDTFLDDNPSQIIRPGEIGANWWGNKENITNDLQEIATLGVCTQRISIEWGRIEPHEGHIDKEALSYYRFILDTCKSNKLVPIVTMNHFVLPEWLSKKGGWENPHVVKYFLRYAHTLLEHFGDVSTWLIVNEPSNSIYLGYLLGIFPPNKRSIFATLTARKNIIATHQQTYAYIKKHFPTTQVGSAFSFLWLRPLDKNYIIERSLTRFLNYLVNTNFISATKDYMDFLGMNYYTGYYVDLNLAYITPTMRNEAIYVPHHLPFARTVRPKTYKTDTGWPIVPDFFLDVLKHIYSAYKIPILITENGIADRDDTYRSFYLLTHLVVLKKALEEGIDIRGYIHWSTVDNLEWVEGYAKRFGLISVHPVNEKRYLRDSAQIYKAIISNKHYSIEQLINDFIPDPQKEYARYSIRQILSSSDKHCPRIEKAF